MSGQTQSGNVSQDDIEAKFNKAYQFVALQLPTMSLKDLNQFITAYEQAIQFPESNIKPDYEANYATAVNQRNRLMGVRVDKPQVAIVPDRPADPTGEQEKRVRSVSAPDVPAITAERNKQIQLKQLISFEQHFQFNQQLQSDRLAQAIKRLETLGGGVDRQRLAQDNINMGLRAIKEVVDFIHRYEQAGVGSSIQETYKAVYEQVCEVRDQHMPAVMNLVQTSLTQVQTSLNQSQVLAEDPNQQAKAASQLKSLMLDLTQKNMTECQQVLKTYLTASSADSARQVESFSQHIADSAARIETQKNAIQVKMTESQEKAQVVKSAIIKLNEKLTTYSDQVLGSIQNEPRIKANTLVQLENARSELITLGLLTPNFGLNTSMPGYALLSTQPTPDQIVKNLHEVMFKLKYSPSEQSELQQELEPLLRDLQELVDSYTEEDTKHISKNPEALKEELARLHTYRDYCVEYGLLTKDLQEDKGTQSVSFYQTLLKQTNVNVSQVLTALNQITEKFASSLTVFEGKEKQLNSVGKPIDSAEAIADFKKVQQQNKLATEEAQVAATPVTLSKSNLNGASGDVATQRKALLDLQRDLRDYGYLGEAPLPTTGKTDAQIAALMQGAAGDKQRFDALMSDYPARDKLLVRLQQVRQQLFDVDILTAAGQENKAVHNDVRETAGLEKVDGNIRAIIRLNTLIARLQAHQNLHPTPEALKPKAPMQAPPSLVTPPLVSPLPASVASVNLSSSAVAPGSFEARAQDFMTKFTGLERDLASYQTGYRIVQLEALQQRLDQYELDVNRFMNDYHDVTDLSLQQIEQYEQILENETLFDELKPQVQALYQKAQQEWTEFNTAFATLDVKTATASQIDSFTKRYDLLKANLTIQDTYQEKYGQVQDAQRANRLRSASAPTPRVGAAAIDAFKMSQQTIREENAHAQRANRLRSASAPTPRAGAAAIEAFKVSQQSDAAAAPAQATVQPKAVVSQSAHVRTPLVKSASAPDLRHGETMRSPLARSQSTAAMTRTPKQEGHLTARAQVSSFQQELNKSVPAIAKIFNKIANVIGFGPKAEAPQTVTLRDIPPRKETAATAEATIEGIGEQFGHISAIQKTLPSHPTPAQKDAAVYKIDQALAALTPLVPHLMYAGVQGVIPTTVAKAAANHLTVLSETIPLSRDFTEKFQQAKQAMATLVRTMGEIKAEATAKVAVAAASIPQESMMNTASIMMKIK